MSKIVPIEFENFRHITKRLEDLVTSANVSYLDAAVEICSREGLEIEFLGDLIAANSELKAHFESEAKELHCLKEKG